MAHTHYPGMINSPESETTETCLVADDHIHVDELASFPAAPNEATLYENANDETAETVTYTGKSAASGAGTLTGVTRGVEGAAKEWPSGTKVARLITNYDIHALQADLDDLSKTGADTQIIFNDTEVLAGDAALTWNKSTETLSATYFAGDGSGLENVGATASTSLTFSVKEPNVHALKKGQAVYISGAGAALPYVTEGDCTVTAKSRVVGLVAADIAQNAAGKVRRGGTLTNVDTRSTNADVNPLAQTWAAGDLLFLATAGGLTNVRPTSGRSVKVAYSLSGSSQTDTLLVYPMENPVWVTCAEHEDVVLRLGDSAGDHKVSIRDYANSEVASIDSNGGMIITSLSVSAGNISDARVIYSDDVAQYVELRGGTNAAGKGSRIIVYGNDNGTYPGYVRFTVPDAAETADLECFRIIGCTDAPYLDMQSREIRSAKGLTLTDNTGIKLTVDNSGLLLCGGSNVTLHSLISLHGHDEATNPGHIFFQVPNTATDGLVVALSIHGNSDTPYIQTSHDFGVGQALRMNYASGGQIRSAVDDAYILIVGGITVNTSAQITLYGKDHASYPGRLDLRVPNAAESSYARVFYCDGCVDNPVFTLDACYKIARSLKTSGVYLMGGDGIAGEGAFCIPFGCNHSTYPGDFWIAVPNAAENAALTVCSVQGCTDTPYMSMGTYRITSLAEATTAADALRYNVWETYAPTLVWSGAGVTGVSTSCRYQRVGPKTVLLQLYIYATDSNGRSLSTITLPVNYTASGAGLIPIDSMERYGTTLASVIDPQGYTYASGVTVIGFLANQVGTAGQPIQYSLNALYECA